MRDIMTTTILLVDDDELLRSRLAKAFEKRGFLVFQAADYDQAMQALAAQRPAYAVIDLKMPGKSGLEVLRDGLKQTPDLQAVVLTGYGSIATATEAIKLGAVNYLPKPCEVKDILKALGRDTQEIEAIEDQYFEPPTLARAEWEHIQRILSDCNGNVSLAAQRLGLHRRTLQRKLYKYPPVK